MNKKNLLVDHLHKAFTCEHPKNTFVIDTSNGYPVMVTTNVDKNTPWKDILRGNYKYANPDGTPQYLLINDIKYTYIDKKYAENYKGYKFSKDKSIDIKPFKPAHERFFNKLFNNLDNTDYKDEAYY